MNRPIALGYADGLTALEELHQRVEIGHHDYAIMLMGGLGLSRKTLKWAKGISTWHVTNHIDGTTQMLTDEGLWSLSNIGEALDKRALLDMDGGSFLTVEGRGPVWADDLLVEARAAQEAAAAEARKNDGPLTFRLDAAPGAITISDAAGEDDDWEPADPSLVLEPCEIGPHTVAQIDLAAIGMGFKDGVQRAAITSIELTIEDIDAMVAALLAIREDAVANRGFAPREDGVWTNGEE